MKLPPGYVPGLLTQHKATAKGGFGEKLLRQFGWTEGKGLGAREDGISEYLKVKQKKDQTGVGSHGSEMWRDKWWEEAYAQSVASIAGVNEENLNESSGDSDSDSSDSEDSTAEVPAAGRRTHADGTVSSATAAEQKLAAQLAKDPWGRFGGRQGKLARIRAQEVAALKARLEAEGQAAASAVPAAAKSAAEAELPQADAAAAAALSSTQKSKRRKRIAAAEPPAAENAAAAADAPPPAKRKRGIKAASKAVAAVAAGTAPAEPRVPTVADLSAERGSSELATFVPTPATGWWGAKRFISAGAMGSTPAQLLEPKANGFTEDTQEGLYMALHNAKSSGKTGLGKGRGSGVIGGAKWEGKKTVIVDEDEAVEGASAETTYEASPAVEEAPSSPTAAPMAKFRYAKIVRKLLQQADGQLSLKELSKQIRQHWVASSQFGAPPDAASFKSILRAKLERVNGITVQGKRVSLTA